MVGILAKRLFYDGGNSIIEFVMISIIFLKEQGTDRLTKVVLCKVR